jgi:hypothetical protein
VSFGSIFSDDGGIDIDRYIKFNAGQRQNFKRQRHEAGEEDYEKSKYDPHGKHAQEKKRSRTSACYDPRTCENSPWYKLYVSSDACKGKKSKKAKSFRRRFRMYWEDFRELVDEIKTNDYFFGKGWGKKNAIGQSGVSVDLLVLGSLRYLGRGWTFDDIEESTLIDEETHRRFFHDFVWMGKTFLFPKWVKAPVTAEEIRDCMHEFNQAGFPGCIGSCDATHVPIEQLSHNLRQNHLGCKFKQTARAFQITVNHRRFIIASTAGLPSRWNDKTIVRFDNFVMDIKNGRYQMKFIVLNFFTLLLML